MAQNASLLGSALSTLVSIARQRKPIQTPALTSARRTLMGKTRRECLQPFLLLKLAPQGLRLGSAHHCCQPGPPARTQGRPRWC